MIQRANSVDAEAADTPLPMEPLALSARDAAAALSIGERTLWALTNSGQVPCVRLGRKVLYPVHLLRQFLTELHEEQGGAQHAQGKSGQRGNAGRSEDRSSGPLNRRSSIE